MVNTKSYLNASLLLPKGWEPHSKLFDLTVSISPLIRKSKQISTKILMNQTYNINYIILCQNFAGKN